MFKIFEEVDKTLIINLDKDQYRKSHVQQEFKDKSQNYEFIKAVSDNDDTVKKIYLQNKVFSYPPCFRCKEDPCSHENNYLTPKQVANFLSFYKIMQITLERKYQNVIIIEDDFKFTKHSKISFNNLQKFIVKNNLLDSNLPLLFRIGSHTVVNKKYYLKLFIFRKNTFIYDNFENMANPCFLVNAKFAELFLSSFDSIDTTSDDYIHRRLANKSGVLNFSIYPFPVSQLSYGRKNNKFESSITPSSKKKNFSDLNKVSNINEYKQYKDEWLNS